MAEKPEGLPPPSGTVQTLEESSWKSSLEPPARCLQTKTLLSHFFVFVYGDILLSKKQITFEQQQSKHSYEGVLPFRSTVTSF